MRRFYSEVADGLAAIREQSISEARNKLKWEAFQMLFKGTVEMAYSEEYETWNGYRLLAIDGTKISLPNYPNLREQFGTNRGSPMARGSILYDVLNFTVCDALLEPLSTDERTMATRHISAFCNSHDICENLIIFDRGYPSADLIDFCFENQITFLMRTRRKFNPQVDDLTTNDDYVSIGGRKIRVIKLRLDSGETEILLTNLSDNHNFKDLYFKRWGIEKEFDVIKNTLEIENVPKRWLKTKVYQHYWWLRGSYLPIFATQSYTSLYDFTAA